MTVAVDVFSLDLRKGSFFQCKVTWWSFSERIINWRKLEKLKHPGKKQVKKLTNFENLQTSAYDIPLDVKFDADSKKYTSVRWSEVVKNMFQFN